MPKLVTDWKKIGQSGPTIDGRTIDPEWLTQAAEAYDPKVYTASIWVDHKRWYGSYGQVVALKSEKSGDVVSLFAKLAPNAWLLESNRYEQKLFSSMELDPDFAETGKCYLVGMGVTDEPASLGTQELRFSRKEQDRNLIFSGVELADLKDEGSADDAKKVLSILSDILPFLKKHKPDTKEEKPMDEKQFKQVTDALAATQQAIENLTANFSNLQQQDPPETPETPETPAEPGDDAARFAQVTEGLKTVVEKLSALEARLEKPAGGTEVPDTTNPADDGDDIL